ncbi:glycerol kinase [Desulfosarcina ovata subsp. sediminis]|uniref:Glycerol kinase n=1 Tax=Desulfosarcina ovata subsp. sediminis TaxID=885957 RepID=A0A5K7ZTH9_9BACT|nr:glycerol kinase GlpK [Desulfosarcina ovata]BBO83523.1 glycerol kinase [Desulfosarcina ovata subsp. sediminis]
MAPSYIGALDLGTTSNRFILFDHQGQIAGMDQMEHQQIFPRPGWVEHDPLEIWQNTCHVIRGALGKIGVAGKQIVAIGITNQRETTVVWDPKTGKPLCNAIVWQCTRTDVICRQLEREGGQDRFRPKTGLPIATYFSGPKVKWILDNVPGARAAAENGRALFGTIETWIIWQLTGGVSGGAHVTDVSNASRTLMMDLETLDWDADILKTMEIPRQMMPRIVPSIDRQTWGHTLKEGPLAATVPVCGALGDQQAALVGQTCFDVGEAKNTYGTGCFMLLNTGHQAVPSTHGLLTTVGYQLRGEKPVYCLEGSIAIAGALVQWLRDNLGLIRSAPEVEALARTVDDNGGVYIVPAFSGLFAPYWRADARGVMVGLTRYANKGHIARAVLEANAYQTLDIMTAMNKDSGVDLGSLKVDGGMVANDLLMQFQADLLAVPVIRPAITETTALGAAYAAGLAVGFWNSMDELKAFWSVDKVWSPQMDNTLRQAGIRLWKKAVERTFGWED